MHCEWKAMITKGDETRERSLEFWSRGGRFFRLDTREEPKSVEETPFVQRLIVRPEGFALIHATDCDSPGAVVDFGTSDEGIEILAGNFFFDSATRHSGVFPVRRSLSHCLAQDNGWSRVKVSESADSYLLHWEWSDGESSTKTDVNLDLVAFRCLNSSVRNFKNGEVGLKIGTEKTYDSNAIVPLVHEESWVDDDGFTERWRYDRVDCSFESPPLSKFIIPDFSTSPHDAFFRHRRMIILLIGVVLTGAYIWIRRSRQ